MISHDQFFFLCSFIGFFVAPNYSVNGAAVSGCPEDNANLSPWSDSSTWGGSLPTVGMDLVISGSVLLDIETPRLGSVVISAGAVLVFSPEVPLAKLSATRVRVDGELWIGSEDCPFSGSAEIFLTEMYNSSAPDPSFGQKFIGVPVGGTLELHGKEKLHWTRLTETVLNADCLNAGEITLDVLDDVSFWEPGDQIVIASSNYNWTEAEVVTVLDCSSCTSNQLLIKGPLNYTHLGKIVDGVDMRAEVGLLTRNIKIHGEMQPACYGNMKCNEFPYDTFGGHVKILQGFKNVHVEGVELYDVGQQTILGSYPIHFHMTQEVGNYSNPPYARSNSIHHSYSRCVTVHGTFGVTVSKNTAYDNLGHCYYLEDGAEKNTTLEDNLAIGTRNASLVPSDATDVSSFLISVPMAYVRNNVAAGSEGHGIMYIFPYEPIGLSTGMNFLKRNQSMHTNLYEFKNNVAHSNAKTGLLFDYIFGVDHDVVRVSNDYNPLQDPLNTNSLPVSVSFNGFTGYNNLDASVKVRSAETYFDNLKISESGKGVVLSSSVVGAKHIDNSIILESIVFEDNAPNTCN